MLNTGLLGTTQNFVKCFIDTFQHSLHITYFFPLDVAKCNVWRVVLQVGVPQLVTLALRSLFILRSILFYPKHTQTNDIFTMPLNCISLH